MAYGTAAPIEARPPDSEADWPRWTRKSLAYQFAQDPLSLVTTASLGSNGDISHTTRCGFTGVASALARSSSLLHQAATPFSISSRQLRLSLRCSCGLSSRR